MCWGNREEPLSVIHFQSTFSKKFPNHTVASFFRKFNAIGPLSVHYALLPFVLSTSFSTHPEPLT